MRKARALSQPDAGDHPSSHGQFASAKWGSPGNRPCSARLTLSCRRRQLKTGSLEALFRSIARWRGPDGGISGRHEGSVVARFAPGEDPETGSVRTETGSRTQSPNSGCRLAANLTERRSFHESSLPSSPHLRRCAPPPRTPPKDRDSNGSH